jgi:transcriptional regulator with XRE-family HTH domain
MGIKINRFELYKKEKEGLVEMLVFGERLRKLREGRKLSQQHLADRFGMSQSTIAYYEAGKKEPAYEILKKFADFFEVSADYLLGLSKSPVQYTYVEKSLLNEDVLTVQDLKEKYKFVIDESTGEQATDEEIEEMIRYIRALRIIRKGD